GTLLSQNYLVLYFPVHHRYERIIFLLVPFGFYRFIKCLAFSNSLVLITAVIILQLYSLSSPTENIISISFQFIHPFKFNRIKLSQPYLGQVIVWQEILASLSGNNSSFEAL